MGRLARFTQTGLVLALLGFFAYVLLASLGFREAGRIFPITIASAAILLALGELARQVITGFRPEAADITDLGDDAQADPRAHFIASARVFAWLIALMALILLLGVVPATLIFVIGLMRLQFACALWPTLLVTAGVVAVVLVLTRVLLLRWPEPLLQPGLLPGL